MADCEHNDYEPLVFDPDNGAVVADPKAPMTAIRSCQCMTTLPWVFKSSNLIERCEDALADIAR